VFAQKMTAKLEINGVILLQERLLRAIDHLKKEEDDTTIRVSKCNIYIYTKIGERVLKCLLCFYNLKIYIDLYLKSFVYACLNVPLK
jgi:hypothetical protein